MKKLQPSPLKKVTLSLPATPSQNWDPGKPPFSKIWLEAQFPQEKESR